MNEAFNWGWKILRKDFDLEAIHPKEFSYVEDLTHELKSHRLEPWFYSKLGSNPATRHLRKTWQDQWLRNQLYLKEMDELNSICVKSRLPIWVLKGGVLLKEIYQHEHSVRPMADLDLLVSPEHKALLLKKLKARGYQVVRSRKWKANQFKTDLSCDREGYQLNIEVHTKLLFLEKESSMWSREPFLSSYVGKLPVEEMLFHLCVHLSYQHSFQKLFWLVDIDRYVRANSNLSVKRLQNLMNEHRQQKSVAAALWAAHRYLDTPLLFPIEEDGLWKRILSREYLWEAHDDKGRYFLLKHLLKRSLSEAIWYDWNWLKSKVKVSSSDGE